ncbi:MAG: hypothetical protein HRU21_12455 [Pseudomonadales bacterium]|nr:hypothetical protein [Pseudomonadales bacterium]
MAWSVLVITLFISACDSSYESSRVPNSNAENIEASVEPIEPIEPIEPDNQKPIDSVIPPVNEPELAECEAGFYGATCQAVTAQCINGSIDDGREGSGGCNCLPGWGGDNCERLAAYLSFSHQEEESCVLEINGDVVCWSRGGDPSMMFTETEIKRLDYPTTLLTASEYQELKLGEDHGCAIDAAQQLICWGRNMIGELGRGETSKASLLPAPVVGGAERWQKFAPGGGHTCAIGTDQSLWCWGANRYGQLGNGSFSDFEASPQPVGVGQRWIDVATGDDVSYAIRADGSLWSWGNNGDAALGSAFYADNQNLPVKFSEPSDWLMLIATEEQEGGCALKTDRSLWCWGRNDDGQLGSGDRDDLLMPTEILPGVQWMHFTMSEDFACGVKMDGSLWCVGKNNYGQLGQGTVGDESVVFLQVESDTDWAAVFTSNNHGYAIKQNGEIYALGRDAGGFGPLQTSTPQPVIEGDDFTDIVVNLTDSYYWQFNPSHFACGVTSNGELKCWGTYTDNPSEFKTVKRSQATIVENVDAIDQIAMGAQLCVITQAETVECSQAYHYRDDLRQVLEEGGMDFEVWQTIHFPDDVGTPVDIAAGDNHACAIFNQGEENSLWCWGDNTYGQLGINSYAEHLSPVQVINTSGKWSKVFALFNTTCAIQQSGAAFCWGINGSAEPELVDASAMDSNWSSLSIGYSNTCGIKSDGSLWCWGYSSGIIDSDTYSPVLIAEAGSDVAEVSVGFDHACVVKTDSSIWCWGENSSGQTGNKDKESTAFSQESSFANDWIKVEVGFDYSCAIKADNRGAYCWGDSENGKLGANFYWVSSPRQIYPSLLLDRH